MKAKLVHCRNKHQYITVFLAVIILFSTSIFTTAKVVDRVVAVVNNEVITLSELEQEVSNLAPAVKQNAAVDFRERTLDSMIDLRLIEQKAKTLNVSVSENEISAAYEASRRRMSLGAAEFRKELLDSGLSVETYRKKLRASILQSKVVVRDVRSKVVITDEMILEYYNKEYMTNVDEGNYYLLQMGFTWDESDQPEILNQNKAAARKKAEGIQKQAKEGQDFKMLATEFSDLPSASDGGDIGVFALDEMAQSMRGAVEQLQPGEISEIIETAAGYQFFKLLTSEEDVTATVPLESVKEEIRQKIGKEEMNKTFSIWLRNLKDQAYIQKL